MDSETLTTFVRIAAIAAGIIFGSTSVSSACFVWVRRQLFGYGGSALCTAGVILIGLSIWNSVEFGVSATGINFKARAEIQKLIEEANMQLAANLSDLNKNLAQVTAIVGSQDQDITKRIAAMERDLSTQTTLLSQSRSILEAVRIQYLRAPGYTAPASIDEPSSPAPPLTAPPPSPRVGTGSR